MLRSLARARAAVRSRRPRRNRSPRPAGFARRAPRIGVAVLLLAAATGCGSEPAGGEAAGGGAGPVPGPPAGAIGSTGGIARPPAIPEDAPLVVFLGDSLTAGYGVAGDQAFPAVVQRELAGAGRPFRLVNAGVSGDTTAGGLRRIDWVLRQAPEVVVVALGANDGLRGLDLGEAEANLRAIVERVEAAGAEPILCGVRIPTNYGPDYAGRFAAMYPDVAEATGAAFVPFLLDGVGGIDAMNLADGIHPNPAGHRRIAATVAPVLGRALEGGPESPLPEPPGPAGTG